MSVFKTLNDWFTDPYYFLDENIIDDTTNWMIILTDTYNEWFTLFCS